MACSLIFWCHSLIPLRAQNSPETRILGQLCRNYYLSTTAITLDSSLLAPTSIRIRDLATGKQLTGDKWLFNWQQGELALMDSSLQGFYQVCFRLLKTDLRNPVFIRDSRLRDSTRIYQDVALRPTNSQDKQVELFAAPGLQKSGSLSRGLSFGNNQSLFVNSALNLQMQGELGAGIRLTALINDQQLPFQPQGNTAQIRELDRVLIQLDHKLATLQAGDVVLQNRPSHFLRYYKNVQGLRTSIKLGTDSLYQGITTFGAAVAKGKFASIIVPPLEGVQGPYRLRTPQNEAFIVIQANSERVYVDNVLLERGFNRDYIIDYNTGEVTFTPRILVTRYSRIRIDFEYAERNYSRGILEANHYQRWGRWKAYVNYYQEQDDGNRPISFTADERTRQQLAAAGDTVGRAVISGAVPVQEFSQDQVLYRKVDTLVAGNRDSVFVYSPVLAPSLFAVSFTNVGQGSGDYVLSSTLANGRVYQWVGRRLGNYLPIRPVATPNRRQMFTAGTSVEVAKGHELGTELAFSTFNPNLYAGDAITRNGSAQRFYYKATGLKLSDTWQLSGGTEAERLDARFQGIDRFRNIEFDRDWSANAGDTLPADDWLTKMSWSLQRKQQFSYQGQVSRRTKGENVNGLQTDQQLQLEVNRVLLKGNFYGMQNNRPDLRSDWTRIGMEISRPIGMLTPGVSWQQERNAIVLPRTDSVVRTAMYFDEQKAFVRMADTLRNKLGLEAASRQDYSPWEGRMRMATRATTVGLQASHRSLKGNNLAATVAYRLLDVVNLEDTVLAQRPREETFQGRLDWTADYWQRNIRSELTLLTGVGRELQREYRYVRVANPQDGTHQWIDLNGDGQQQLDEFVEAQRPEDRLYIKIFVPTANFQNAYSTNLNYRLTFRMPAEWRTKGWGLKQLGKLSGNLGWTLERRILSPALLPRLSPWVQPDDIDLLSNAQAIRGNLYYNRTDPAYGADISLTNTQRRSFLTSGFEAQEQRDVRVAGRMLVTPAWNLSLSLLSTNRNLSSNFLTNRNYRLTGLETTPEFTYQPDARYRVTLSTGLASRFNLTEAQEARVEKAGAEFRWAKVGSRSVTALVRVTNIQYDGDRTSPATYDLLEGLLPGTNYTWTLNWQQSILNGLQLTLSYDGRQSQGQQMIHLGRMQVTALF